MIDVHLNWASLGLRPAPVEASRDRHAGQVSKLDVGALGCFLISLHPNRTSVCVCEGLGGSCHAPSGTLCVSQQCIPAVGWEGDPLSVSTCCASGPVLGTGQTGKVREPLMPHTELTFYVQNYSIHWGVLRYRPGKSVLGMWGKGMSHVCVCVCRGTG